MRGVLAICALVVVAATAFSSAAARPVDRPGAQEVGSRSGPARAQAADAEPNYGIPKFEQDPDKNQNAQQNPYAGILESATTTVARSKVTISIPGNVLLNYQTSCLASPLGGGLTIQTCCPDAFDLSTCAPKFQVPNPASTADELGFPYWTRLTGPVWIKSPKGAATVFGEFASVKVQLLAFGSIPATATIHVRQHVGPNGQVEPISFNQLSYQPPPAGTKVVGFPEAAPADGVFLDLRQELTGSVDVRISDVAVDGQPVDVGPVCRTRTPAELVYRGPKGWYDGTASDGALTTEGRPGGYRPVAGSTVNNQINNTGRATGNIAIPAFTGCRDGARRLDPLITALASGPTNRIAFRQAFPFYACDNPARPFNCPDFPGREDATGGGLRTAAAGGDAAAPARSAGWSKLTAQQRAKAARALAHLPARLRTNVLRSMPREVVAAVKAQSR